MGQRSLSLVTLFGLGIAALALFRFTPSPRPPVRTPPGTQPTPVWREHVSPALRRLRTAYSQLTPEQRGMLAEGAPYTRLPSAFRAVIHDLLEQQFAAHTARIKSEYQAGVIGEHEYREMRTYDDFVPKHLSDYEISARGDNFAMILFRTLLPGHDYPKQDAGRGIRVICQLR